MGFYQVKAGDTLSKLAEMFNTSIENLQTLNNIKNPNSIFIGQNIKFDETICEQWQDCDGDKKVSFGDFQGCGNYAIFLDKINKYIGKDWNNEIAKDIQKLYLEAVKNPKQANMLGISINNKTISFEGNSNFYRNNLDSSLAEYSLSDSNPTKIEISLSMGKEISFRDRKISDFLKKVLGDNLDNTSQIEKKDNQFNIITTRMENTDLYKAFISDDVNPDMVTQEQNGKYKDDVFIPNFRGKVQIPSVEINSNGIKYFTLQKKDGNVLYFDETGKNVKSLDEINTKDNKNIKPDIPKNISTAEEKNNISKNFTPKDDYKKDKLNIGNIYIDGEVYENDFTSNYYQNSLDKNIGNITISSTDINKIEIQLKAGEDLKNKYDTSAKDILKKFLGDNLNNTTSVSNGKIEGKKLEDTDLYKKFIEINPDLKNLKAGTNINIQLPALKIAPNGERYFTFINSQNQVLYFDEFGGM